MMKTRKEKTSLKSRKERPGDDDADDDGDDDEGKSVERKRQPKSCPEAVKIKYFDRATNTTKSGRGKERETGCGF